VLSTFHFDSTPHFIPVETQFILREGQSTPYFHPIWEPPKLM
jgi:hypothetical protein